MNSSPFVNIHTHNAEVGQAVSITNVFLQHRHEIIPNGYYSLGLHPWHISEVSTDFDIEQLLKKYINTDKWLLAIGEIGLDKEIDVPFHLQIEIFEKQLKIAQTFRLPVIIHCVRAYNELIQVKKKLGIFVPLIIHDYHGNEQTTKELLKHGFSFSFGKQLFKNNKNAEMALQFLPLHRVYFETDIGNQSIEGMYQLAAHIREIPVEMIRDIINENFKRNFEKI